ncbi:MAG: phosphodiesterase [Leptolyngbyaceae cyanobacterium]
MSEPILLAQLTDCHLLAQTTASLRGCNSWESFNAVLQDVISYHPDGLLLTGDLAERGEAAAYQNLVKALRPYSIPVYWLPGNHDCLSTLRPILQQLPTAQGLACVDLGTWQLILLDSVLPQATFGEGYLSDQQLQTLYAASKPTLIALHHHPVPVGIDWVDQMQVQNAQEFLELLNQFANVKCVVFGHIHHEFQQQTASGISFYGCPSTGLQVTSSETELTEERPGFRLIWLHDGGHYRTEVKRVDAVV